MTKLELSSMLTAVSNYFERKLPTTGTVEQWYETLAPIPAAALPSIEKGIKSNETFPRNLPGAVWALYHAWLDAHPEQGASISYHKCPDGCDKGVLHVVKYKSFGGKNGEAYPYTYAFSCAACNQGPAGYPHARLRDLLAQGYQREESQPHAPAYYKIKGGTKGIIKALVEKMSDLPTTIHTISVEKSQEGGYVEKTGVQTIEEPSEDELLNVGQI